MSEKRVDQILVELNLFESRSKAQAAIAEGLVFYNKKQIDKPSQTLEDPRPDNFEIKSGKITKFVSRAGLKLEGALHKIGLSVKNATVLDVGQSTGGFTDCLLQNGAIRIVGLDVGFGQIHPKISSNPKVEIIENTNIRQFQTTEKFDLCVIDVSFISLTRVLPVVIKFLKSQGKILALVKPQFELSQDKIGKGGIVKNQEHYIFIENAIKKCCQDLGLSAIDYFESSILGGDGNKEFFVYAKKID